MVRIHKYITCYAMYNMAVKNRGCCSQTATKNTSLFQHTPVVKLLLTDFLGPLTSEGSNLEKVPLLKEKLHVYFTSPWKTLVKGAKA